MLARLRERATLKKNVRQIDVTHRVAGVHGRGFGVGGPRRRTVSRFIKECAEVIQRRAVRWLQREDLEISVSGIGGTADFGQQTGSLKLQRNGGGIGCDLRFEFL